MLQTFKTLKNALTILKFDKNLQQRCIFIKKEQIESDIYLFVGDAYHANATVLINNDEVLLIDGLASSRDAAELRSFIENELKKQVRAIISTHYMSDHIAAFRLFPEAQIITHKNFLHTFHSQKLLTEEERAFFVRPTLVLTDGALMRWGRFSLDIFHNAGKTLSSLNIDIPEADLLIVGDEIFGNTVFLSSAGLPEMFASAIKRLQRKGRNRVIPGHLGVFGSQSFENALFYLNALQVQVYEARRSSKVESSILEIAIESCLAPQVTATDFEKEFHRINLQLIIERELFMPLSKN